MGLIALNVGYELALLTPEVFARMTLVAGPHLSLDLGTRHAAASCVAGWLLFGGAVALQHVRQRVVAFVAHS